MTRVVHWSDLHTESNGYINPIAKSLWPLPVRPGHPEPVFDADVLVMAGDCFVAGQFLGPRNSDNQTQRDFAKHLVERVFPQFKEVIYVPGNHEYYCTTLSTAVPILQEAFAALGATNLHILNNDYRVVDDTVIYGTTLWTSVRPQHREEVRKGIIDFHHIGNDLSPTPQRFDAQTLDMLHNRSMDKLEAFLNRCKTETALADKKLLVATHHAPSMESLNPWYNVSVRHAYATDLDHFILGHQHIKAWVHGHTHWASDYTIGKTRVVSNPFGCQHHTSNYTFRANATLEL